MKTNLCVVTGCNGDIGRSISKKLSKNDFYVLGIDKVRSKPKYVDEYICCDFNQLISDNHCRKSFKIKLQKSIKNKNLSLLVNNAAVQHLENKTFQLDKLIESFNVNSIAPHLLYKICENNLIKNHGVLVNIGSIHSTLSKSGFGYYAASKSALKSLTNSIALNNNADVLTYLIEPAAIDTKMLHDGLSNSSIRKLSEYHPSCKIGSPENIAEIIFFLVKSKINFLHGTNIDLSGGIKHLLHDPE